MIVDVTISSRLFVFGQSGANVSARFTNVSSLAVAGFDLVYCSLSILRFVFVLDISMSLSLTLVVVKWLSICVQHKKMKHKNKKLVMKRIKMMLKFL